MIAPGCYPINTVHVSWGDLGASVLKIEQPGKGDYGRWIDADSPGKYRLSFLMLNRNKESMTLNLKSETGKEIFKKLAAQYDVVFETFRPRVMDRLGLGYFVIKENQSKDCLLLRDRVWSKRAL